MDGLIEQRSYTSEQLRDMLCRYTAMVAAEKICRGFYVVGPGGIGKTRLLREYSSTVKERYVRVVGRGTPELVAGRIIDMSDASKRNPIELEAALIGSLKQNSRDEAQRLPAQKVNDAFANYRRARDRYHDALAVGANRAARTEAEKAMRNAFVAGWNELSKQRVMIMRFDTVERVFNRSGDEAALIQVAGDTATPLGSGGQPSLKALLLRWLREVLPQLRHTLVLFAARPASADGLLPTFQGTAVLSRSDRYSLASFSQDETRSYLIGLLPQWPTLTEPEASIERVMQITEGRPLLLNSYKRFLERGQTRLLQGVSSRRAFEDLIARTLLDPTSLAHSATEDVELSYCLCLLSYTRRGITLEALRALAADLGLAITPGTLTSLQEHPMVRMLRQPQADTPHADAATSDLLALHDEIWAMIDAAGVTDNYGMREHVLPILCKRARSAVRDAMSAARPEALIQAMSDLLAYELARDLAEGYRIYTVCVHWMLRLGRDDEALVLADSFWSTILLEIEHSNEVREPFKNVVAQSPYLRLEVIHFDDLLHRVWLYLAQDRYSEATALAWRCFRATTPVWDALRLDKWLAILLEPCLIVFREEQPRLAPPSGAASPPPLDRADLHSTLMAVLTLAHALLRSDGATHDRLITALLQSMIALLGTQGQLAQGLAVTRHPGARRDDILLTGRRLSLLGQTYLERSYLHRSLYRYDQANEDLHEAQQLLESYRLTLPLDDPWPDIAQAHSDMAMVQLHRGALAAAARQASPVLRQYGAAMSSSQYCLIAAHEAAILLQQAGVRPVYVAARRLGEAYTRLKKVRSDTVSGIIMWRMAQLYRTAALRRLQIDFERFGLPLAEGFSTVDLFLKQAKQRLNGVRDLQREVIHDRGRVFRDAGFEARARGDAEQALELWRQALHHLLEALVLTPQNSRLALQRAELLSTCASAAILLGDDRAGPWLDEAETLLADPRLPRYAHVVMGKVMLQRGLLLISPAREPGGADPGALVSCLISALASIYCYANTHPNLRVFTRVIVGHVARHLASARSSALLIVLLAQVRSSREAPPRPLAQSQQGLWEEACDDARTRLDHALRQFLGRRSAGPL